MIASLGLILLCQLLGEIVVRGVGAPIPGPVVGLIVLLLLLQGRDRIGLLRRGPLGDGGVERAAGGMLAHLSLLFVPAGVGVVQHLDLVSSHGVAIFVILALSAVVTLVVTSVTFIVTSKLLERWRGTSS
ncbi:CidA/LrgA family protein [Nitrobacteraceae bacterium UC4446_H13]